MNNEIVKDSFYLIYLYNQKGIPITQLHIQKLMFLFEAYYMNKNNVDKVYDDDFQAWDYGPVNYDLYRYYKKNKRNEIHLNDKEQSEALQISPDKRQALEAIFEIFKDFSANELVSFTHQPNSPWSNTVKYGDISKQDTKAWFKQYMGN